MTPIPLGILDFPTGGAGAYDLLETQVLTSQASSVTFTGLGSYSDYKHLEIRCVMQGTTVQPSLSLRLNGDTGNNYSYHTMDGYNRSVRSYASGGTNFMFAGNAHAAGALFASSIITFLDFSDTNKTTTMRYFAGKETGNSADAQVFVGSSGWFNTSAVTSILLYPSSGSFNTNSRFSLYGVK